MPDLSLLAAAARRLFPPGVAVAATNPRVFSAAFPGEELINAVPARQSEFSAGRAAARAAMAELGLSPATIPSRPDRAPDWPKGCLGSITHSKSACLAAVTRVTTLRGIGLDLEPDTPLDPNLWPTICLVDELNWLEKNEKSQQGQLALLIFSAKEAAYKCQYAISEQMFGFETLHVQIAQNSQSFTATFRQSIGPFSKGTPLSGRYVQCESHILTAVTIP
ncbi:MAG: 4'-phosphopantetheinyl transferase superfamily protein [Paracoccaceae bacterium]